MSGDDALGNDYKRLQQLEGCVISCIDIAASVAEELSKIEGGDPSTACTAFLDRIKEAQALVIQGASTVTTERKFEADVYQQLTKATLAQEKLEALRSALRKQGTAAAAGASGLQEQQQQQ